MGTRRARRLIQAVATTCSTAAVDAAAAMTPTANSQPCSKPWNASPASNYSTPPKSANSHAARTKRAAAADGRAAGRSGLSG
jgi:hypothetical protein